MMLYTEHDLLTPRHDVDGNGWHAVRADGSRTGDYDTYADLCSALKRGDVVWVEVTCE